MFFVDSHCHLNFPSLLPQAGQIIGRAKEAGIECFLTACTKLDEVPELIALTRAHENVFASVGVHPEYAAEQEAIGVDDLCALTDDPKIVALGEAGLDYHYAPDTAEEQRRLFRTHLRAAKKAGLPLIIHTREAEDDTIQLLQEEVSPDLHGVLHCFSSQKRLAEVGLKLGFYISASGIITFKSAQELRETFRFVPMNRLLLETDAPYLAPVPFRGRDNEPAFLVKTAETLAKIKDVSLDELKERTTENFFTLFSKASLA